MIDAPWLVDLYRATRNPYSWNNIRNQYIVPWGKNILGYTQYKNQQEQAKNEISYNEYLKGGAERYVADWHRGFPGREIKYPEFGIPGQIARTSTSIANSLISYDNAFANYTGNIINRAAGLYGIPGRLYRSL